MKRLLLMLGFGMVNAIGFAQTNLPAPGTSNQTVIAVVCGKEITGANQAKLNGLIFGALLEKFAKENNIAPTDAELDAFQIKTEEFGKRLQLKKEQEREKLLKELESTSLGEGERNQKTAQLQAIERTLKSLQERQALNTGMADQMRPIQRQSAEKIVTKWKINHALYQKYGGRVIFQQAGAEPLDAYRFFLKEQERAGVFQIIDKQYEAPFWQYFINNAMHTFLPPEKGAKAMTTPWWLMENEPEPPATPPASPVTKPKTDAQQFWIFECRGTELFFLDKDELDGLFKKMLAEESASGHAPANPVGNANYIIDPESGIGMLRLRPRTGVPGDVLADLAQVTGHYQTLLKQFAHTRPIIFIDHGASAELLERAEQLAVAAGFEVSKYPLPKDQPIMFSK